MAQSKFYCENCGSEVKHSAKLCPKCGRFFSAVRCPKCSFTGEAALFRSGCPSCGYAGSWHESASHDEFTVENYDDRTLGGAGRVGGSRQSGKVQGSAPGWVYWLAMGLLAGAFLVLVLIYVNL